MGLRLGGWSGLICLILVSTNALDLRTQDKDEMHLSDFDDEEAEIDGECETEVRMAEKKCSKRQSQLKEIVGSDCGDTHLQSVMKTIHSNHIKTQQQQSLLHQAEQHLKSLGTSMSSTSSMVHRSEIRVVHSMSQLSAQQSMYSSEEHQAMSLSKEEKQLFEQAQAATQSAVNHAKTSEDTSTTTGMRDKATDLFEQYVHKRVLMATLQRQEKMSKSSITTLTANVQHEKEAAEKAMAQKKEADDKYAAAQLQVKSLVTSVANSEFDTSQTELKASEEEMKMLMSKISSTHTIIQTTSSALDISQVKASKAEHLAESATHLVTETEDMSLKALLAQSEDMDVSWDTDFDAPWKRK